MCTSRPICCLQLRELRFIDMYMHCIYPPMYMLMRFEEGRKKQARSNKQQSKATQHTQVYNVHAALSPLRPESHLVLGGT